MSEQELLAKLRSVIAGDAADEEVVETAEAIIAEEISSRKAIDEATAAIREVGDDFESGKKYLPELMIAAKKMEDCLEILKPHLSADDADRSHGRVVIGTVSGDIHDLGKNLVATMLTLGGFEVTDAGINVAPFDIINEAKNKKANIIALSALMTTSMPYQEEVISLMKEMDMRKNCFVIVGGGPVTPKFAEEIGADGYTEKAGGAIRLCDQLMSLGSIPPLEKPIIV
jgi:methylmalonyl-CoA mutase cobalamin-binding domain/chain